MVGLLFVFVVLLVFIIWDNNRIIVVEQEIGIENLPGELEGFTILQVSDLHEKEFGKRQKKLINSINNIHYDAIVFTGDMLDSDRSTHYQPFYDLIEGIYNKEHAIYVPGNADPNNYISQPQNPFDKHDFIKGMEERGVYLLESIHSIQNGQSHIHFVEFELSILDWESKIKELDSRAEPNNEVTKKYLNHLRNLYNEISLLDHLEHTDDAIIALNHYPIVDARIDFIKSHPEYMFRNFDLILAGHYHGGQIRLPFLGALFVPEPWYDRNGLFPPQDRVKGLWEYERTKQYVSTGLGSSDAIPFLQFRFLNPPEINLLTLTKK
ncbi:metallophosphoesterase [Halalkalibacter alkalisediminis]|uniref:Metallophosphoesterase n=1 Tax=Halalkalibacter alkalisediminis TaxID=935616 RepID=A0ABV6NH39_9BACI|nr:metallophosphoesterase [Halalkalibacter alkalisediminis]